MNPTASITVIGNEILSGRTQDKNISFLTSALFDIGIETEEVHIIPDNIEKIASTVNHLRSHYSYVFTTGGLGPTHDDITVEGIAKAFDVDVIYHPDAVETLNNYYKEHITESRLRMARTPFGATLINNPVSAAPGFQMENVFTLAGVPNIAEAMFFSALPSLNKGSPIFQEHFDFYIGESLIANQLRMIQEEFPDVSIGSYPNFRGGKIGVTVISRGRNQETVLKSHKRISEIPIT